MRPTDPWHDTVQRVVMAMSLADAKVIVQGQRAKSVVRVRPQCRDPLHPHNFKELGKTGQLPESAKHEEGGFQLLQHVKTFNSEFLLFEFEEPAH